jgi:NADH:ubiquinone oxidoreductase subunit B-like Fe-S oxidoreductase
VLKSVQSKIVLPHQNISTSDIFFPYLLYIVLCNPVSEGSLGVRHLLQLEIAKSKGKKTKNNTTTTNIEAQCRE